MKSSKLLVVSSTIIALLLGACTVMDPSSTSSESESLDTSEVPNSTSTPSSTSVDASTYYNKLTATKGTSLLAQLHDLVTSTHTRYLYYSDCANSSNLMKSDKYDDSNICEFYSQKPWGIQTANASSPYGLNREHCWPQSLSNGLWGTYGGGADLHHIRPAEYKINGSRGNNKYGTVTHSGNEDYAYKSSTEKYLAGYRTSSTFEPLDFIKGDVARIILYTYVHYNSYTNFAGATTNGSGSSNYFGNLAITKIIAGSETSAFALLVSWNAADPVDEKEIARNNYVFSLSGNRNPFIDHSEYVSAIWG